MGSMTIKEAVKSATFVCSRCGKGYSSRKTGFSASYAACHKGAGSLHVCKDCTTRLYEGYLAECGDDTRSAVRQMCRKLDLYWSETIYKYAVSKDTGRTLFSSYLSRVNSINYAGKSYDDTLIEEGKLWEFSTADSETTIPQPVCTMVANVNPEVEITDEIVSFWGTGYTPEMYAALEQRLAYWKKELASEGVDLNLGAKTIIRQICSIELDINRDRAEGKPVDKLVNTLNTLLGSANLKPTQRKDAALEEELSATPLGVWLWRYENKRPLPEIDESLKDVNHIKKYIFTWMGHLCKMVGVKNGYTKLYEEEIERLRVELPEYGEDEEEDMLIEAYSGGE